MPLRLASPLLTVDAAKMHQIDTTNVQNLFSMWTVFNRCAESMEEGRRLENLSWRLWNRETFCCESKPKFPDTPRSQTTTPRPLSKRHTPELSSSIDSLASAEDDDYPESLSHPAPTTTTTKPHTLTSRDFSTSPSRCKPISSYTLEKMVVEIKEGKAPKIDDLKQFSSSLLPTVSIQLQSPPVQYAQSPVETRQSLQRTSQSSISTAPIASPSSNMERSQTLESDTSADLIQSSHSIVRGFAPDKPSSHRSSTSLMTGRSPVAIKSALRKSSTTGKGAFMLGGSSDDESSYDDSKSLRPSSSLTAGLRHPQLHHTPKMTTFREEVEIRGDQIDDGAIDSDSDDDSDDISESAIEEDEEAWEDDEADGASDQGLFQRVSSKPNLVSRRSLLTSGLTQSDRAADFAHQAAVQAATLQASKSQPQLSHTTHTSRNSKAQITQPSELSGGITQSKAIAMPIPTNSSNPVLSPKTTRRNMLSTELTESLRQNLLWERQFKNTKMKRRHTAHENLDTLRNMPETDSETPSRKTSWTNIFSSNNDVNTRGW